MCDISSDMLSLEMVRVVRKFMDVFPTYLSRVSLDIDIDFGMTWSGASSPFSFLPIR